MAWVRLGGVVFATLEIGVFTAHFPPGYETAGWILTGVFAVGALAIFRLANSERASMLPALGLGGRPSATTGSGRECSPLSS